MIDAFNFSAHKKAKVEYTNDNFIFSLQFANGAIDYFIVDTNSSLQEQTKQLNESAARFDAVKTFVNRHPDKQYMKELMMHVNSVN